MLPRKEEEWRLKGDLNIGKAQSEAYISQVFHDIVEKLRLFVVISHSVNGLFDYKIFGDFGPHSLCLRLHANKSPSPI